MHTKLDTVVLNQPCGPAAIKLFQSVPSPDLAVDNRSVKEVIQDKLSAISSLKWESDQENAFFVGDLGEVFRQHLRWKALLPRIEPFFGKLKIIPSFLKFLTSVRFQPSSPTLTPWS